METIVPRHNVFISYHVQDKRSKDEFVQMMGDSIVDKSVNVGDIDDTGDITLDAVRQRIRDEFIAPASVTVVLIGPCTWRRKHVDWEIASSISETSKNFRCGLLGIFLPNHPNYNESTYDSHLIPPRLADNCNGDDPFALVYDLPQWNRQSVVEIQGWIHKAFNRRKGAPPNNRRPQFGKNWKGPCSAGWQG